MTNSSFFTLMICSILAGTSTNEVNVEALGDQLVAMDRESYSQMKKYGTYLAAAYIITSAMMATSAALVISSADTPTAFVCIYVFMFAVILFCFDCSGCFGLASVSKEMANNCGFMYTGFGRGTFLIFVAVLCFQLKLLGQITMGLLIASTVFHWYVVYKFPQFSAYLRRSHLTNK